jgi:hypothetical protein
MAYVDPVYGKEHPVEHESCFSTEAGPGSWMVAIVLIFECQKMEWQTPLGHLRNIAPRCEHQG